MTDFPGALDYRRFFIHPERSKTMYWVSTYGILVSYDGGNNWQAIELITPPGSALIYGFAVNPKRMIMRFTIPRRLTIARRFTKVSTEGEIGLRINSRQDKFQPYFAFIQPGKTFYILDLHCCRNNNYDICPELQRGIYKAADHVKHDIASLRTGRATPALVEDVSIEAYGPVSRSRQWLRFLFWMPKLLSLNHGTKSLLGAVDAGIRKSELGLNPVNDGKVVRVPLPTLTSERRAELIKILHQKLENGRIAIRKLREDVKQMIDLAESAKEIGEDEKFRQYEELEKLMKEMNERIKVMGEEKEREINTV